ncbi:unnamed protein product [Peronospora effusa]|nr:unnamed protein product [Peronospora effusa]
MLIVTMLIAWSAASVASAMLKDAMPSTYDYTTSNNTYTGASISNADMASNYSDDKPGERTLLTPQTLETPLLPDSALTNFANLLERYKPNLFEGMKLIKKRQKLKEIRKVQDGIVMLARNRNIFLKHLFNNWKENVKKVLPDVNNEALIGMLTHHFESDHALASALVQGKGEIAEKLKNMQVETWVKNEENEKGVFELLQLDKTNPFQDSIASQWVNFIEKKYNSPEEPYKVLDIVLSYFETGMNGLMGALLGALNAVGTKVVAQKLLNLQYKKWQEEKKMRPTFSKF